MNRLGFGARLVLWLLVIAVGVQFGAGLYEKLAIVPLWSGVDPASVLPAMRESGMYRAGRAFWPFVSPVVGVFALVGVVVSWRCPPAPARRVWLAGSATMLGYAVISYGYFVPQMLRFQANAASWDDDRIEDFVAWWTGLNYGRMVLGAIGLLLLLRALSLSELTSRRTAPMTG